MGAITFGFLQRAGSLYGTGMDRNCRALGATAGTAMALNTVLGKNFVLAQADESFIKLTNLLCVEGIEQRLQGLDGVILGNSMVAEPRPVTAGTFEKGPNDKTVEVYWDTYRGRDMASQDSEAQAQTQQIIDNLLQACKNAGIQHIVAVDTVPKDSSNFAAKLQSCGVPYSLLQCSDKLVNLPDYTYRRGVQDNLQISALAAGESTTATVGSIYREDVAALCVQCLQSLDWNQKRTLLVQSGGPLEVQKPSSKRPDQEWCVNSHVLAAKLESLESVTTV